MGLRKSLTKLQKNLYTIVAYIITMETTIQISKKLQEQLQKRKIIGKESYEEVIWDLLEDTMELSEETKIDIEEAKRDIKEGRIKSLAQVKKELGF